MGFGGTFRRDDGWGDARPRFPPRPFAAKLRQPVDYDKMARQLEHVKRGLHNPHKKAMAGHLLAAAQKLKRGGADRREQAQDELRQFDRLLKEHFNSVLPAPFCRMYLRLARNDLQKLAWGER